MQAKSPQKLSFNERCYALLREVPAGQITTYGEIARALKSKAFRAVGQAMNRNPYAPEVPCHRVINSDGSLGGFAWGGQKKIALLAKEGVRVKNGKVEEFRKILFKFKGR